MSGVTSPVCKIDRMATACMWKRGLESNQRSAAYETARATNSHPALSGPSTHDVPVLFAEGHHVRFGLRRMEALHHEAVDFAPVERVDQGLDLEAKLPAAVVPRAAFPFRIIRAMWQGAISPSQHP